MREEECLVRYQNEISRAKEVQQESNNPNEKWGNFKTAVVQAATNTIQKKAVRGKKKKQTAWWTPTLKSAVAKKMKLFRK